MVSSTAIAFMFISLFIAGILPWLFMLFLNIKFKMSLRPVLVGAVVFIVFQVLTRIPAVSWLATTPFYTSLAQSPLLFGLFFGFTAGLFEEFGRLLGFKVALKKNRSWLDGIAYGIGHGGTEAFLLVGLSYVNNIVFALALNSGSFDAIAGRCPPKPTTT